jgi:hypothetical protein
MRISNWVGCILAAGLGGCSLYPVIDDVGYLRTEEIVLYGRCEVRSALFDYLLKNEIIPRDIVYLDEENKVYHPDRQKLLQAEIKKAKEFEKSKMEPSNPEQHRLRYLARLIRVAIAYSFDFHITEHNSAGGSAGFRMPWAATNVLDVGAAGAIDLTRVGSRVFGTEDSWEDYLLGDFSPKCDGTPWDQRTRNVLYPLTGSIGVGNVVRTFIEIEGQGGAKDNFVDTLTFTTDVGGGIDAAVKIAPVPSQFRLVSATASVAASRVDIHKLTVSLAFPSQRPVPRAITGVVRADGDLNAPFERPPVWRARYNLCVQDARTRENAFKQLRLTDPVVYCIGYADQFAPKYGQAKIVVTETVPVPTRDRRSATDSDAETTVRSVPRTRTRVIDVRPNVVPR